MAVLWDPEPNIGKFPKGLSNPPSFISSSFFCWVFFFNQWVGGAEGGGELRHEIISYLTS